MKLKVKNLKSLTIEIQKRVRKVLRDKDIRDGLGDILVEYIRTQSFGRPAKATIAARKYLEKYNVTDPDYNRSKIKAIFTGKLLEDLASNVKADFKPGKVGYVFEQSNKKHPKYQGKTKKVGSRSSYKAIQEGLENLGYNYVKIDDATIDKMINFIRSKLLNKLS